MHQRTDATALSLHVAGDYLYHCYNSDCAAPAPACGVIARHHYCDCFDIARHALRMSRGAHLEQALAGLEGALRWYGHRPVVLLVEAGAQMTLGDYRRAWCWLEERLVAQVQRRVALRLESVHREFRLWLFEPGYPARSSETTAGREREGPAVISLRLSLYQFRSGT